MKREMELRKIVGTYCVIIVLLAIFLFPLFWMLLTSIKPYEATINFNPFVSFKPTLENYIDVFQRWRLTYYLKNSIIIATFTMLVTIILAAPAAYVIARFKTGGVVLLLWIMFTRMILPVAFLVPLYLLFRTLSLLDTYPAITMAHTVFTLSFGIWLLRAIFLTIPAEIEEAAMTDGCTRFAALVRIVLPLSTPGIVAVAIVTFAFSWNEFILALMLTGTKINTFPVVASGTVTHHRIMWGAMSAMGIVGVIPVIIITLLAHKHLLTGFSLGTLK